jgi:hypothetical protein
MSKSRPFILGFRVPRVTLVLLYKDRRKKKVECVRKLGTGFEVLLE